MQVKRRLTINTIIVALSVIATISVLYLTANKVVNAMAANKIADALITSSFERMALRSDYMRTNSERAREQVRAKFEQISTLLASASETFTDPEDKRTIASMREGHESIGKLFRAIVENREQTAAGNRTADLSREIEDRLLSQLDMRVYEAVLLGSRLQESAGAAHLAAFKMAAGGTAAVLLLLGAITLSNSWAMNRTITNRITQLREGAKVIGGGDLTYRIELMGDDEFTGLSEAFNTMTAKLRISYEEIANEIEERRRAETMARVSEDRLRFALETSHIGAWDLDLSDHTSFRSLEHDRIFGYAELLPQWTYEMFLEHVLPEDRGGVDATFRQATLEGGDWSFECRIRRSDGEVRWIWAAGRHRVSASGGARRMAGIVQDITERKQADQERATTVEFLQLVNRTTTSAELVREAAIFFKHTSDCEAVGIRLKKGDDYPYFEAHGFPEEFVNMENSLCDRDSTGSVIRDDRGNPVLSCMCGNVILGRTDASKPFFTAHGSFWSNCTTDLLASTTDADRQTRTRNRCNGEGYESVALIALRVGSERLGLLQLNDRRKNMFTPQIIAVWERLGGYLSVALANLRAEEALMTAHDALEVRVQDRTRELSMATDALKQERHRMYDVLETLPVMVCLFTPDHHVSFANKSFRDRYGESFGRPCHEYCFGKTDPCDFCETYNVLKTGQPHHWEINNLDGSIVDAYDFPFTDTDGSPLILQMGIDITERKRAEAALHELNEKLEQRVVERTSELLSVNETLRTARVAALNLMEDAVAAQDKAETTSRALEREIAERKRTQAEYEYAARQLQIALDAAHMGWWHYDPVTKVASWDDGYREIFGVTDYRRLHDEILADIIHPEDLPAILGKMEAALDPVNPEPYMAQYRINRPDGSMRWIEAHGIAAFEGFGKDKQATALVGTVADITERKKADAVRGQLSAIVEGAEDSIISMDLNGIILTWNKGAQNIFGYQDHEAIGRHVSFLLPPGKTNEIPDIVRRLMEGKRIDRFETERLRKDGSIMPVSLTFSPIKDSDGTIVGISKTSHDITDRKRAEEALRWTYERFYTVLSGIYAAILLVSNDDRIEFANQAFCDMFGFDVHPANLKGMTAKEILAAIRRQYVDPDAAATRVAEIVKEQKPVKGETVSMLGGRSYLRDFIPLFVGGSLYGRVWLHVDLTKQKQAEEAIVALNRELEGRIFQRTRFYTVLADVNAAIVRLNDQKTLFDEACRIIVETGGFKLAWVGTVDSKSKEVRPVSSYGASSYLDGLRIIATSDAEGTEPTSAAILEGRHMMSSDFERDTIVEPWLERARVHGFRSSAAFPLKVGDLVAAVLTIYSDQPRSFTDEEVSLILSLSENLSFAMAAFDIEKERRAALDAIKTLNQELELRVARRTEELEFSNRELEAFIYSVSHDLRAPLRTISGFSKILMEDYPGGLDAEGVNHLERIYKGSTKMSQLIDDLLRLSRISRQELVRSHIDMTAIASSIIADLRERDASRTVEVTIGAGLIAFADMRLIQVALLNLFENAWKFISKTPDGRIEFGSLIQTNKIVYFVKDNGAGFNSKYADKMFLPFHRLHAESEFEGTGIGLAIVDRVIKRHGGTLWADGEQDKGATFFFTLE